jgi:hypothetical protein
MRCCSKDVLQERGELPHERNIGIGEPVAVKLHSCRRDSHQWAVPMGHDCLALSW